MQENRILRARVAGQSAMSEVVRAQAEAAPRSLVKRILGFSPLTPTSRALYRGALGELLVGDVLNGLGPRWDALHDLPLGDTVLDHLIIGPAGVFTVRTANYGPEDIVIDGTHLVVGGEIRDDIERAGAEAVEVARILTSASGAAVGVKPLLVLVQPKRVTVKVAASAVRILVSGELERMLERAPRTMPGDVVAHISDLADLVTTWPRADAVAFADTQQLHHDFAGVRDEVRVAISRRVLLIVAAAGLAFGIVWGLVGSFVTLVVSPGR